MDVSRVLSSVVVAGLILSSSVAGAQPFGAAPLTPHGPNPACAGFDPYKWTRAQIEACQPGGWPIPGYSPYNGLGEPLLFTPFKVQAFANVLVGLPGLDNDYNAFLTLENDVEANVAHIIIRGGTSVIQRAISMQPDQRIVERLNEWPELEGQFPIGVSVRVRWLKEGNAGVAMHRMRDYGSMVQAVEGGGTK